MEQEKKKRYRIALFTSDDEIWALPTWKKTIPLLLKDHDFVGIYLFPERLANLKGMKIPLWYLNVFGYQSSIFLALFGLKRFFYLHLSSISNWKQLAQHYGVQLRHATSPNSEEVVKWTKDNEVDIIFIMVGNILKEQIIKAPKIGIINKHAAILPSCRGIFPFFWAKLTGVQTGFTFHMVDTGIDTGKILLQVQYPSNGLDISLLRFYIDVFAMFPQLVIVAINNMITGNCFNTSTGISSSYYSLPTKQDNINYRKKGFRISRFSDLFYSPSSNITEVINEVCSHQY
jgi:folate-dependent phosphoribosylglycinamide formyltransferase PurN